MKHILFFITPLTTILGFIVFLHINLVGKSIDSDIQRKLDERTNKYDHAVHNLKLNLDLDKSTNYYEKPFNTYDYLLNHKSSTFTEMI